MQAVKPTIVDKSAHAEFLDKVVAANLDPADPWVRDYVSMSWERARPYFMAKGLPAPGSRVLEFGCNLGASSIMLASMGGEVTAIDINPDYVDIARANARAHGVPEHVEFLHVADTRKLPFADNAFDLVVCNSVLEYVHDDHLDSVLGEIDRVLKAGGILFVLGTSSGLWPREVHSRAWLVNYLPRTLDPIIRKMSPDFMRGLSPWRLLRRLERYENLDRSDGDNSLLAAKRQITPPRKYALLRLFRVASLALGTSLGLLLPSITVALKKPQPSGLAKRVT
ncbi:MAG: class I SAM-dependent methyltransferase [Gallionella sp.]|nr:MAG: class I SAM-dependent methyltransferase [Gallionella sp.]